jgi:hypothetical protein
MNHAETTPNSDCRNRTRAAPAQVAEASSA